MKKKKQVKGCPNEIWYILDILGGRPTVGDVCLEKKILAVQRRFKGGSLLVNYKNCPIVLN